MKALPSPALQARFVSAGELKPTRRIWRGLLSLAIWIYAIAGYLVGLFNPPHPLGW